MSSYWWNKQNGDLTHSSFLSEKFQTKKSFILKKKYEYAKFKSWWFNKKRNLSLINIIYQYLQTLISWFTIDSIIHLWMWSIKSRSQNVFICIAAGLFINKNRFQGLSEVLPFDINFVFYRLFFCIKWNSQLLTNLLPKFKKVTLSHIIEMNTGQKLQCILKLE